MRREWAPELIIAAKFFCRAPALAPSPPRPIAFIIHSGLIQISSHKGVARRHFFSRLRQTVAPLTPWRQLEQSLKIYDA
jgi:hypothetical protein